MIIHLSQLKHFTLQLIVATSLLCFLSAQVSAQQESIDVGKPVIDLTKNISRIAGLERYWTNWGSKAKPEFIEPQAEKSGLHAQSQNIFEKESIETVYTSDIISPRWLPWWTWSIIGCLVLGLIWVIRRYEMRNIKQRAEALRLKELNAVQIKLYSNITHEFRTPLTVIMGMTDEFDKNPEEAKEMIRRNSEQLLHLINQMLDLSKLESGQMKLKLVNGDVIPYLKYLVESFHSYAETKEIDIHFSDVDELVMDFDTEKLQQIVSNLLSNAIKFTPEKGKISIHVTSLNQDKIEELVMKIKDDGIGIEALKLPHVFDRFYQVDDSHTRKGEGTGIGLAYTKELVQLMGGTLNVISEVGTGTEFTLTLPVSHEASLKFSIPQLSTDGFKTEDLSISQHQEAINAQSINIDDLPILLIIEDNPDVVTYISSCLQGQYFFEKAENGLIGIEKAIELVPDIIISDVMMPEKDGFEVCNTLKNDGRTSHIPIILLTAKATAEDRISGLQKGADAYLTKPFNKDELTIRLKKLIELRQRLLKRYTGASFIEVEKVTDIAHEIEDTFLIKLKTIVEKRLDDSEYSIPQFCMDAGMSRTQLHRKLKALTGKSASLFIRSIRLQNAKKLLQTTDLNISEIAYDVGFHDPSYFSRSFLEEFGNTPTEERK